MTTNTKLKHAVLTDGEYIDLTVWEPKSDAAKVFKAKHMSLGMELCPTPTSLLRALNVHVGVDSVHFLPPSSIFSADYPTNIAAVFLFDRYAIAVGYDVDTEVVRQHIVNDAKDAYQEYSTALENKLNNELNTVTDATESE